MYWVSTCVALTDAYHFSVTVLARKSGSNSYMYKLVSMNNTYTEDGPKVFFVDTMHELFTLSIASEPCWSTSIDGEKPSKNASTYMYNCPLTSGYCIVVSIGVPL